MKIKISTISLAAVLLLISNSLQNLQSTPIRCSRSPSIGGPINYIHKGLEQIYSQLYKTEVSAIPRMILDYHETGTNMNHYSWFFPSVTQKSMLYLSVGNITNKSPILENLFYSEVNDQGDPNAAWNQVLAVLGAVKLDPSTRTQTGFKLDKNSNQISEYTVQCGDVKNSFQHFQKFFKNDFSKAIGFFA